MNELETILDESLDLVQSGEATIEEVLARYPEYAAELSPLLQVAARLSQGAEIRPSPVFKSNNRTHLNAYMREHPQIQPAPSLTWQWSSTIAILVLMFIFTATVAAQRALPGDTLYGLKLTSETAWRTFARDQLGVDLTLSERRVSELVAVSGDERRRARAVENYQKMLVQFKSMQDDNAQARILPVLRSQQQELVQVGVTIPELDDYFLIQDGSGSGKLQSVILVSMLQASPGY